MFTARITYFGRFPAAPLQVGTAARTKNHFSGPYCGKNQLLQHRGRHFPHKAWPERHLEREGQCRGVCKSRAGQGNTIKYISKTKERNGASFASYCLEKIDNKGKPATRQKNVSGGMKGNATRDKRDTRINISQQQKDVGRECSGNRCTEESRAVWLKRMQRKPRRKTKHRHWRKPGTRARNKRKSVGRAGSKRTGTSNL